MGKVYTLSGPRGVGKTATIDRLVTDYGIEQILTYTDRSPRAEDIQNPKYHFVKRDEMTDMLGESALTAVLKLPNGERYGTLKQDIEDGLSGDAISIVTSATQTARKIKRLYPEVQNLLLLPRMFSDIPLMMMDSGLTAEEIHHRLDNDPNEFSRLAEFDALFINPYGEHDRTVSEIAEYITGLSTEM